jgi:hypothetical protein
VACIDEVTKEILLSGASFKECRLYVEGHFKEVWYVDPGYKIFDKYIIGVPPIAVGVDGDSITFPFTKPCYGTFLLRIQDAEEIERIRKLGKKKKS